MLPETEHVDAAIAQDELDLPKSTNVVEAIADGAMSGVKIAVAVGATLLAFVSVIALLNGLLGWFGGWFGHRD
ncbi:na+ dependent nucleoside transporter family protein [Vibrio cholerae]|nr:na+ dependent nucleoside transporter family protein [Vibrio cholerae]